MRLVVFVARLHQELVLQPVGQLHKPRVKCLLYILNIALADAHLTQFHAPVKHLVHHVDIHQVALRQLALLHLAAVPERHRGFRQTAHLADEVAPRLHLAAKQLMGLGIKCGILAAHTLYLLLAGIHPTAHEAVIQVALTVGTPAAEKAEHLVKRAERRKHQLHKRVVHKLVNRLRLVVLVARAALHVAVGVVLYLAHALLLGLLERLRVGHALAQAARHAGHKVIVSLCAVNPVLPDCLARHLHILAVGFRVALALVGIVMRLLHLLAQIVLLGLAPGDVLHISQRQLQTGIVQGRLVSHRHIGTAHTMLRIRHSVLNVGALPTASLLKHLHRVRTVCVKLTLHLHAACVHLRALDAFERVQRGFGILQLVVHHDVHHLPHIALDVVVPRAVLHRGQQTLHLLLAQVVQITAVHQHTRKVGHTLHRRHVKLPLQAHRLAQVSQVAAYGTHGIIAQRLVVRVVRRQPRCSSSDALMQAHTAVLPDVLRLVFRAAYLSEDVFCLASSVSIVLYILYGFFIDFNASRSITGFFSFSIS